MDKVYLLHERSGEWEDRRNRIIGVYLNKDKCEFEKLKLEKKESKYEAQSKLCQECVIVQTCNICGEECIDPNNIELCINKRIKHIEKYCSCHDIFKFKYKEVLIYLAIIVIVIMKQILIVSKK